MEPPELDIQGQLERRALVNVRRLYERLDRKDSLARNAEYKFIVVACVIVASVLALLVIAALLEPSKVDAHAVERTLCISEALVDSGAVRQKELRERFPEMRSTEMNKVLEGHFRAAEPRARAGCELKFPKSR